MAIIPDQTDFENLTEEQRLELALKMSVQPVAETPERSKIEAETPKNKNINNSNDDNPLYLSKINEIKSNYYFNVMSWDIDEFIEEMRNINAGPCFYQLDYETEQYILMSPEHDLSNHQNPIMISEQFPWGNRPYTIRPMGVAGEFSVTYFFYEYTEPNLKTAELNYFEIDFRITKDQQYQRFLITYPGPDATRIPKYAAERNYNKLAELIKDCKPSEISPILSKIKPNEKYRISLYDLYSRQQSLSNYFDDLNKKLKKNALDNAIPAKKVKVTFTIMDKKNAQPANSNLDSSFKPPTARP